MSNSPRFQLELTIGDFLDFVQWYNSMPAPVQKLMAQFPPGTRWRLPHQERIATLGQRVIKSGDWWSPTGFTEDRVEMRLVSGESGQPLACSLLLPPSQWQPLVSH